MLAVLLLARSRLALVAGLAIAAGLLTAPLIFLSASPAVVACGANFALAASLLAIAWAVFRPRTTPGVRALGREAATAVLVGQAWAAGWYGIWLVDLVRLRVDGDALRVTALVLAAPAFGSAW